MDTNISELLKQVMESENCSALRAFYLIVEGKESDYELHLLQCEPKEKQSRRLRDKSYI